MSREMLVKHLPQICIDPGFSRRPNSPQGVCPGKLKVGQLEESPVVTELEGVSRPEKQAGSHMCQ